MAAVPKGSYLSRLNLLLAVFAVAVIGLIALGRSTASSLVTTQRDLSELAALRSAVQKVQYDFANVNGWQNAYALDLTRSESPRVTDITSRKSFVRALDECRRDLVELRDLSRSRPEHDRLLLASVFRGLDDFARLDDQIIALYQGGDAAGRRRADDLVMNQEIAVFASSVDSLDGFATDLAREEAANVLSASASGSRDMWLVVILGTLVLIVGLTGSWLIARSIRQHVILADSEARATHQALHDPLTGLANRSLLYDRLTHALVRAERAGCSVGVLFLDMDNFKTINDSLGHTGGDELLIEVAQRLTLALRGSDLAARLGGDEFVLACEDLMVPEEICSVAERVLTELQREVRVNGKIITVSASIGAAVSRPGSSVDDLLRDADAAMYRAKNSGKGHWEMTEGRSQGRSM